MQLYREAFFGQLGSLKKMRDFGEQKEQLISYEHKFDGTFMLHFTF